MPVADEASRLFFVISGLGKIDNMYRFRLKEIVIPLLNNRMNDFKRFDSLASFLRLFERALKRNEKSSSAEHTVRALKSRLLKVTPVFSFIVL